MYPQIHASWAAIVGAVVASFFFGWLWYGPLFGHTWARLAGIAMDTKPDAASMTRSMGLTLLGTVLTAYVLFYASEVWHPSVWKIGTDAPAWRYGFFNGFFTWVGFYVPMLLGRIAWQNASGQLFGLDAAYHLVNLQLMAMILAYWR
ncbi:MAG: DUF1761 domain-containing protein [Candidatus Rokubacteria bacterium]|nr:DUF1761 domain-containing protein [Candidatus Rokubacteria bacterium]